MSIFTVIGIAFALAMDVFAVSIATSAVLVTVSGRQIFRMSFHFGLFQGGMCFLGWLGGSTIVRWIESYDHWVAFGLLAFIGGRMIYDSMTGEKEDSGMTSDPTKGMSLVTLSVATSIDALTVGLSLAVLNVDILLSSVTIGLVSLLMGVVGMCIGGRLGERFGDRTELVGGLVLVGIGVKIVVEHIWV